MRARIGAVAMAIVFALYIWLLGGRAVVLLRAGIDTGEPIAVVMGAAIIVFPLVGAWALIREMLFAYRGDRLARQLENEGGMPDDEVALRPSGRVERADADAAFARYRAEAEAAPEDWRAWMRLSVAYSAAGDSKRARGAVREAIRLDRAARA